MGRKKLNSENSTKAELLEAAIRLFGEKSFDAVSVRDITAAAKANLGAVNYHFQSKLNLIREVLKTLATPINQARLEALDAYERELGKSKPEIERVIRILVEPYVRAARDRKGLGMYYPRLLMLARTLPGNLIGSFISDMHDEMALRFVRAMSRSLPNIPDEEIFWRYDFTIGSTLNIVGDSFRSYRLRRLSGGKCDTSDADRVIDELVEFISAGMRGKVPAKRRKTQVGAERAEKSRPRLLA